MLSHSGDENPKNKLVNTLSKCIFYAMKFVMICFGNSSLRKSNFDCNYIASIHESLWAGFIVMSTGRLWAVRMRGDSSGLNRVFCLMLIYNLLQWSARTVISFHLLLSHDELRSIELTIGIHVIPCNGVVKKDMNF